MAAAGSRRRQTGPDRLRRLRHGQQCGAGGVPNKCGTAACVPRTCAQMKVTCGRAATAAAASSTAGTARLAACHVRAPTPTPSAARSVTIAAISSIAQLYSAATCGGGGTPTSAIRPPSTDESARTSPKCERPGIPFRVVTRSAAKFSSATTQVWAVEVRNARLEPRLGEARRAKPRSAGRPDHDLEKRRQATKQKRGRG